jgi:hypothetical protein
MNMSEQRQSDSQKLKKSINAIIVYGGNGKAVRKSSAHSVNVSETSSEHS